jgi:cation diffusion facilitator family transporter
MVANALENRADVYSSVAALIGVFGARLGLTFLDPVAAIVVGFMIARTGVRALVTGIKGATDQLVDSTVLARAKQIASEEETIRRVGRVRGRKIGQKTWIDVEVKFGGDVKMAEVREAVDRVRKNILDELERTQDVVLIPRLAEPELKEIG